jgi:hypothetical protein
LWIVFLIKVYLKELNAMRVNQSARDLFAPFCVLLFVSTPPWWCKMAIIIYNCTLLFIAERKVIKSENKQIFMKSRASYIVDSLYNFLPLKV